MTSSLRPLALCCLAAVCFAEGLGQFESSADVGVAPQKGKVEFDAASGEYRVTEHLMFPESAGSRFVTPVLQDVATGAVGGIHR